MKKIKQDQDVISSFLEKTNNINTKTNESLNTIEFTNIKSNKEF